MGPFRFRARVALELRERRDEEAQRALAAAQEAERAAAAQVRTSTIALDDAVTRATQAEDSLPSGAVRGWHRNWIVRKEHELAESYEALASRESETKDARSQAIRARRERRSLECLRDRAWQAYQREQRRLEQRELDILGSLKYALRRAAQEGAGDDRPDK